jgi:hypothetical protein
VAVEENKVEVRSDKPNRPIESNGYCKHVHISERTKTEGTPYIKGWCATCSAWVYTDKSFCICCMKRVAHKTHHRHTKQVLEHAVLLHEKVMDEYRIMPYKETVWVETEWKNRKYHIPLKDLILWVEHPNKKDIMDMVLDHIRTVRG